jgi:hypothetical protein
MAIQTGLKVSHQRKIYLSSYENIKAMQGLRKKFIA